MKQILQYFSSIFIFLPCVLNAQVEEAAPLTQMPLEEMASFKAAAAGDTIVMPIIDDFSDKSSTPNQNIWSDNKVFINSTIPTGLLSIGAATFDGTDIYGYPYDIKDNSSDSLADVLTSRYIRFVSPPSNVYLSFLYQAGGNGELPEVEDSLVVEFWSPQDSAWEQVWAVKGNSQTSNFRSAIIAVDQPKHLVDGFRFRLGAYGARNGVFDIWNIDYVQLDGNRNAGDTTIIEPAFVRNHAYLSGPFTHMPWFHYNDNLLQDSITLTYRRNGPPPSGGWALNLGKYFINKDGTQVKDRLTVPVITNLNHDVDIDFKVPIKPITTGAPTDEFELFMRTWFDGTAEGRRQNDTVEINIPFKNYYAFDDGSAERGYGILNQTNARVAFQFHPTQTDTLKGLFINFAHSGTDASLNSFRIVVWEDKNGEPGFPIYISDSLYTPEYPYYHNGFMAFDLDKGFYIPGSVYIGMIQTKSTSMHVGFDLNTTNATKKYYGSGFTWLESLIPGTLMIRPYFKYTPRNFGLTEEKLVSPKVFPNPASHSIWIEDLNLNDLNWVLMNNLGVVIERGNSLKVDVSTFASGLYFLKLNWESKSATHKIIVN